MPSKTIRFSDELAAKVQAHADALDRSFSYIVTRVMEEASRDWAEVVKAVEAGAPIRVEAGSSRAPVEKEPDDAQGSRHPTQNRERARSSVPGPASSRPAHNANFNRAGKLR